jgi:hypothetical protein
MVGPQFQDSQSASAEILLILEIFVGEDEEFKSGVLCQGEQVSVFDTRPSLLLDGRDVVPEECVAHLRWDAFVEQDLHAAV